MRKFCCIINLSLFLIAPLLLAASCHREESLTVKETTPGVTETEIKIGSSCALTGHASFLGISYIHGAKCYIDYINEKGGIHGRRISLITYDDGYDPP
ncbi:MAG: ABC transporter substrate-binding protein, partial [Deltaproteobacteria bacterium]|nr:ABC transporter substrate-binding protein [Deltaproteobacteria bacterium]